MVAPLRAVKRQIRAVQLRYLKWRAPAILHITHWKAGSQWLHKILHGACPERTVAPQGAYNHLLKAPVEPGRIYPTVYATRQQLAAVPLPPGTRRFVIIRDLRDTLVSLYFSAKMSHASAPLVNQIRPVLQACDQEEGLLHLIADGLDKNADIQLSWLGGPDPVLRYEELLRDDENLLARVLLGHCRLPVLRGHLRNVVRACRFENLTGGRARGQEDVRAHERKGIAGDWRNYFSARVMQAFKERFGQVLIATGYERDLDW